MSQKVAVVEIEHDVPRIDLLTEDTIDPRVNAAWTRNSTATYRGSDGLIKTAPPNTPRKQFNPDGTFDKWLIEPARTNSVDNSGNLSAAPWVSLGGTGVSSSSGPTPDGSGTVWTINAPGVSTTEGVDAFISVTDTGQDISFAAVVHEDTAQVVEIRPLAVGGTTQAHMHHFDFSAETWIVDQTGTARAERRANGWWRLSATMTLNNTGQTDFRGRIRPVGGGTVLFWHGQVEINAGASTSEIFTTGGPATRAADDVVLTGPDFDALGIKDGGTIVVEGSGSAAAGRLFSLQGTNNNERVQLATDGSGIITAGGTSQTAWPGNVAEGVIFRAAIGLQTDNVGVYTNGALIEYDPGVSLPDVFQLFMGSDSSGRNMNGGIRSLIIYPNRLPNAELQKRSVVGWRNNVTRIGEQSLASDIHPRLVRSPEVSARVGLWIWETETTSGVGDIEAINADGGLDFLLDQVIRDKPVRVLTGTTNDNLQIVANLKGDFIRANNRQNLDIAFAPLDIALQNTFQDRFYDETAPNPNLEGNPFPVLLGAAQQVPATLFDPNVPTYHIFDNTLEHDTSYDYNIERVASNGAPAQLGSQWSSTPFGFDMLITPAGKVTATVGIIASSFGGIGPELMDSVVKQILLGDNLDSASLFFFPTGFVGRAKFENINIGELDFLQESLGSTYVPIGFFADQPVTTNEVLKQIFDPYLAWFIVDPTGQMRFNRLRDPDAIAGDPVLSITPEQIQERTAIEIRDDLMPGLTDTFGARRNWYPISEESAAGVLTLQEKAEVAADFRIVVGGSISDLDPFYQWAHNRYVKESLVTYRESAQGMRKALIEVAGKRRRIYTVRAIIPDPPELLPGQKVRVTWPSLGLEDGKNLVLLGFRRRFTENIIELELWG